MGGSKRIDYTERNRDGERDSRHHHSPADDDEYFANPSMFAATMPPQRTTTIQSIEMGQYAVNSNKVDWNGKGGGELPTVIAVPIASMPKSKESFYARSGSSEQSGSSPVVRLQHLLPSPSPQLPPTSS
ncbi:hypothetical protein FRC17_004813 [Serendipita sp. 399]|nr:hypothetical protein FRC17_004813 [Serendipita sp. 399]